MSFGPVVHYPGYKILDTDQKSYFDAHHVYIYGQMYIYGATSVCRRTVFFFLRKPPPSVEFNHHVTAGSCVTPPTDV